MTKFVLLGSGLALLTHLLTALLQTILHRALGHHFEDFPFYRIHVQSHHSIYAFDRCLSERYFEDEKSVTHLFAIPAFVLGTVAFMTLPRWLFLSQLTAMAISYAAHVYLHTQYHLTRTWLARFKWFCRKRALHFQHHREMNTNFAVIEFLWDRLLGTYRAVDAHRPPKRITG